ncbi:MAG: hypothetical protein HYX47_23950 [Burkholderiales bacterium]|nr:hypothetical protein [Burkholderiales bacterium]
MAQSHEYKGTEFTIQLSERNERWSWAALFADGRAGQGGESFGRTETVAAAEAVEAVREILDKAEKPIDYVRKTDGKRFAYRVRYVPGTSTEWVATVTIPGQGELETRGALANNTLAGAALYLAVRGRVEAFIENPRG